MYFIAIKLIKTSDNVFKSYVSLCLTVVILSIFWLILLIIGLKLFFHIFFTFSYLGSFNGCFRIYGNGQKFRLGSPYMKISQLN